MFDNEFMHNNYKPTPTIANRINWTEIQTRYRIYKKFKSVMDKLQKKGYISDHGKSGEVYSLTFSGVAYVRKIYKN